MKAILVFKEMPSCCRACRFNITGELSKAQMCEAMQNFNAIEDIERRPDWCPLIDFPDRIDYTQKGKYLSAEDRCFAVGRAIGWNECLDEIEGTGGNEQ